MKKLSVILSVLLCLSAMVTGVSAKSTGEVLTGDDALAIYEKCMKKMSKAEYLEVRGFLKSTDWMSTPPKITREVGDLKLVATMDNKLQVESQMWDARGERTEHVYADGSYIYDCFNQEKSDMEDLTLSIMIYAMTGTEEDSYKDNIENLKAEKIDGGYRLRYRLYDDKYTLLIGDDFRLESVANVSNYGSKPASSTFWRYEILSINRPFKIKFPADLSRYDLV